MRWWEDTPGALSPGRQRPARRVADPCPVRAGSRFRRVCTPLGRDLSGANTAWLRSLSPFGGRLGRSFVLPCAAVRRRGRVFLGSLIGIASKHVANRIWRKFSLRRP